MSERWVVNASPLIVLARVGQTRLLTQLAEEVCVPDAVAAEIQAGPDTDPARQWLAAGKLPIVATPSAPSEIVTWDLGAGETAVLTWAAAQPGWTVILDDAAARKCARSFGLRCKGTLGIVILAHQRGLIPSATTLLRAMVANGFRLEDTVIREALARTIGESW